MRSICIRLLAFVGIQAAVWAPCSSSAASESAQEKEISIHKALLQIMLGKREFNKANEQYEAIIALAPKDSATRFRYGETLLRQKHLEGALVQLRKAVDISPTNSLYQFTLARAAREAGKTKEAAVHEQKARELLLKQEGEWLVPQDRPI